MATRELVHRLNRIIGQIEAIKRSLEGGDSADCVKNIQLLKAVNNALKKFGEAYVSDHMTRCLEEGSSRKELEKNLKDVINSAFSL
ncbi:MAG: metal-sensitive transcriptional regulator [Spirochaetales bacterium]|nr:metal-sensitive transcriptional regulator [Leptospiraceae bacterium]MCP5482355.1 metal-sensitive transcriptional regulator [Spirochaetales bacterium]MCP5484206.1 metal-sensitive transcriptional regulator [Spirochaetales bacterium]